MPPAHPLTPHLKAAVEGDSHLRSSFVPLRARRRALLLLSSLAEQAVEPGREFRAYARLAQLFDSTIATQDDSLPTPVAAMASGVVGLAIALIGSTPEHHWSVRELARAVSISPSQLTRLFGTQLGMSPGVYLREQRLHRLAALLSKNDLSVSEAARHAGWESTSAASRSFRTRFGVSPSSFARGSFEEGPPLT